MSLTAVPTADEAARASGASPSPPAVVLIGVSGSGKTTVGALLAKRLGWIFADGDRFHSPENIAKMMALKPLTDADRSPWLAEIGGWIDREAEQSQACVVACSALKRVYRDVLRDGRPQVRLVYLVVPSERLRTRMLAREGHMFAADMLASQLAILEPQPEIAYAFTGDAGYMFPRPDGILLGGTFERNVWEATPQPDAIARIVASHQRLFAGFRCTA